MHQKPYIISLLMALLFFSGCAQKTFEISTSPTKQYQINYNDIRIKDYALEKDIKTSDVVWVNGWIPVHKGFKPALHEALHQKMLKAIQSNNDKEGRIDIAIIEAGLYSEKNFADDMAFIQFFRLNAERGFKCTAILNIENNIQSKRVILEHQIKRTYFDKEEEIIEFVNECEDILIEKAYNLISNEFNKSK